MNLLERASSIVGTLLYLNMMHLYGLDFLLWPRMVEDTPHGTLAWTLLYHPESTSVPGIKSLGRMDTANLGLKSGTMPGFRVEKQFFPFCYGLYQCFLLVKSM